MISSEIVVSMEPVVSNNTEVHKEEVVSSEKEVSHKAVVRNEAVISNKAIFSSEVLVRWWSVMSYCSSARNGSVWRQLSAVVNMKVVVSSEAAVIFEVNPPSRAVQ